MCMHVLLARQRLQGTEMYVTKMGDPRTDMSKVRPGGQLRPVFKFSQARSVCYQINNMRPTSTVDHSLKYMCTKKLFYFSPEDGSSHVAAVILGLVRSFPTSPFLTWRPQLKKEKLTERADVSRTSGDWSIFSRKYETTVSA